MMTRFTRGHCRMRVNLVVDFKDKEVCSTKSRIIAVDLTKTFFVSNFLLANTMSEGTGQNISKSPDQIIEGEKIALPTVFKWDGGGKQVYISGTFSNWKALPMVKSHGDFVTIIDLPEGEHQFKFCVDGEWKHDPKMVSKSFFSALILTPLNSYKNFP